MNENFTLYVNLIYFTCCIIDNLQGFRLVLSLNYLVMKECIIPDMPKTDISHELYKLSFVFCQNRLDNLTSDPPEKTAFNYRKLWRGGRSSQKNTDLPPPVRQADVIYRVWMMISAVSFYLPPDRTPVFWVNIADSTS